MSVVIGFCFSICTDVYLLLNVFIPTNPITEIAEAAKINGIIFPSVVAVILLPTLFLSSPDCFGGAFSGNDCFGRSYSVENDFERSTIKATGKIQIIIQIIILILIVASTVNRE
ncbi:MAG: hypothetical protein QM751_15345 [Paludibacteraceae bacterium]